MIYAKTAKGHLVTPTNPCGLSWPERFALMLVNGHRTEQELRESVVRSDFGKTVSALFEGGFIRKASDAEPAKPAAATVAREQPRNEATLVRRAAVRWLADRLGPYADPINLKVERASTAEELMQALRVGAHLVRDQLGVARAEEFGLVVEQAIEAS